MGSDHRPCMMCIFGTAVRFGKREVLDERVYQLSAFHGLSARFSESSRCLRNAGSTFTSERTFLPKRTVRGDSTPVCSAWTRSPTVSPAGINCNGLRGARPAGVNVVAGRWSCVPGLRRPGIPSVDQRAGGNDALESRAVVSPPRAQLLNCSPDPWCCKRTPRQLASFFAG